MEENAGVTDSVQAEVITDAPVETTEETVVVPEEVVEAE